MKKIYRMFIGAALAMLILFSVTDATKAAPNKTKKEITYTMKDGTLTIAGKGAIPKKKTFYGNLKIKKLIIKKGITSIPRDAFRYCYNLESISIANTVKEIGKYCFENTAIKKIYIPKSVKKIGQCAFDNCPNLKYVTMPGNIDIKTSNGDSEVGIGALNLGDEVQRVKFTTDFHIKSAPYFETLNLVVRKNDKKYKSIDGVVYSKDGKEIVRVPNARKEITVVDGCKVFCTQSVLYCGYYWEGEGVNSCWELKSVTMPESIETINTNKYAVHSNSPDEETTFEAFPYIKTTKLKGTDYVKLMYNFPTLTGEKLAEQLPDKIKIVDDMVISNDGTLIKYEGRKKIVNVPDNIKRIGSYAFEYDKYEYVPEGETNIKTVNLPDTVTHIDEYAFSETAIVFDKLPTQLKYIGEGAFKDCGGFKDNKIVLPKKLKRVGAFAFQFDDWNKLVIPKSVEKIGRHAFSTENNKKRKVIVNCSGKKISGMAFSSYYGGTCKNLEIKFNKGIKTSKTCIYIDYFRQHNDKPVKVRLTWAKIINADGYKIKVSKDPKNHKKAQTIWAKKGDTSTKIIVKDSDEYENLYVSIRPYKIIKGKKVYGQLVKAKNDE